MNHDSETEPSLRYDGQRYDRWHYPVQHYGPGEMNLERQLAESDVLSGIFINKEEWEQTTKIADDIIDLILRDIKEAALEEYGLILHGYVRQGSAREGLSTEPLNDLYVVLKFAFEELDVEYVAVKHAGKIVSEFAEEHVNKQMSVLRTRFSAMERRGVFLQRGDSVLLRSRALHENVFALIVDKAIQRVNASPQYGRQYRISIRAVMPPPVSIAIKTLENQRIVDIDIVPGLVINTDRKEGGRFQPDLPLYCVFNWRLGESCMVPSLKHPDALWKLKTVSYELYLLDTSRHSDTRNYTTMALRILKAYFRNTNPKHQQAETEQSPLTGLLRSYHLKHVAFYCLLYLDIENKRPLKGIREALGYIVDLLEVSLQEKHLPRFLNGNPGLKDVIPGYVPDENHICFDLYGDMSNEDLRRASHVLDKVLRKDLCAFIEDGGLSMMLVNRFRKYIHSKCYMYFQKLSCVLP